MTFQNLFRGDMQLQNQIKQGEIVFESHIKTTPVKKLKAVINLGNYNQIDEINIWFLSGIEVLRLPNFANKDEGEKHSQQLRRKKDRYNFFKTSTNLSF